MCSPPWTGCFSDLGRRPGILHGRRREITLTATGGAGINLALDEAWLFDNDIGQLVQVACGTPAAASGGPDRRLFVAGAILGLHRRATAS